ncbi:hypothetical protein SS37A_09840 [Methylocystis iwaonis]|uniref:Uncharacterized protein n=1 Tax=Methylocystis iwaonis TaxID=2885079 RepID=A0ABM8E666_9HYPH|nr:hypothetical protein SS37A_09840 [Methylocystis iwaonis]
MEAEARSKAAPIDAMTGTAASAKIIATEPERERRKSPAKCEMQRFARFITPAPDRRKHSD